MPLSSAAGTSLSLRRILGAGSGLGALRFSVPVDAIAAAARPPSHERFARSGLITAINADRLKNSENITGGIEWRAKNTYNDRLYAVPCNRGAQPLMYDAGVTTTSGLRQGSSGDRRA